MKFEIKNRFSGDLIIAVEAENWRLAVEAAIKQKADLSWADLSWADLSRANLSRADLSRADLSRADLRVIKHDLWGVLLQARHEVVAFRDALINGKVDGSTYSGKCSCLCGTIAKARGIDDGANLPYADSNSPIERFFLAIKKGDTPKTNQVVKIALEWIDEFVALAGPDGKAR